MKEVSSNKNKLVKIKKFLLMNNLLEAKRIKILQNIRMKDRLKGKNKKIKTLY